MRLTGEQKPKPITHVFKRALTFYGLLVLSNLSPLYGQSDSCDGSSIRHMLTLDSADTIYSKIQNFPIIGLLRKRKHLPNEPILDEPILKSIYPKYSLLIGANTSSSSVTGSANPAGSTRNNSLTDFSSAYRPLSYKPKPYRSAAFFFLGQINGQVGNRINTRFNHFRTEALREMDSSLARSGFQARSRTHIPILLSGASLSGVSLFTQVRQLPLTARQVHNLCVCSLLPIDRSATTHYSKFAQTASDGLALAAAVMPLLCLKSEKTRKEFGSIVLMQAETGLLTYGLFSLTKTLANRPRPYVYNSSLPLAGKLNRNSRQSFYSGHVAMTASMTFFTATTFAYHYPDSQWKRWVWLYALVWPAATGYGRYAAGKHFPTDILTGYVMGALTGWLVPKLHQQYRRRYD